MLRVAEPRTWTSAARLRGKGTRELATSHIHRRPASENPQRRADFPEAVGLLLVFPELRNR